MPIRQKYYFHVDAKFKLKRTAKRNQINKIKRKKTVGFPAKASNVKPL